MLNSFEFRLFVMVMATILTGCAGRSQPVSQPLGGNETAREIGSILRDQESITFTEQNGEFGGPISLTLSRGWAAHCAEAGTRFLEFDGSYQIDLDGPIHVMFPTYQMIWPPMELHREGNSLLLIPKAGELSGGMGMPPIDWPLRMIKQPTDKKVAR